VEPIIASHTVRSAVPGVQEALEQVDRSAGEHGEVCAVTGEGDGQVRGEGDGRSWFAGSPNSQVSGSGRRSSHQQSPFPPSLSDRSSFLLSFGGPDMCRTRGLFFDFTLVMSLADVPLLRHWSLVSSWRSNFTFGPESRPLADLAFLTYMHV